MSPEHRKAYAMTDGRITRRFRRLWRTRRRADRAPRPGEWTDR